MSPVVEVEYLISGGMHATVNGKKGLPKSQRHQITFNTRRYKIPHVQ